MMGRVCADACPADACGVDEVNTGLSQSVSWGTQGSLLRSNRQRKRRLQQDWDALVVRPRSVLLASTCRRRAIVASITNLSVYIICTMRMKGRSSPGVPAAFTKYDEVVWKDCRLERLWEIRRCETCLIEKSHHCSRGPSRWCPRVLWQERIRIMDSVSRWEGQDPSLAPQHRERSSPAASEGAVSSGWVDVAAGEAEGNVSYPKPYTAAAAKRSESEEGLVAYPQVKPPRPRLGRGCRYARIVRVYRNECPSATHPPRGTTNNQHQRSTCTFQGTQSQRRGLDAMVESGGSHTGLRAV